MHRPLLTFFLASAPLLATFEPDRGQFSDSIEGAARFTARAPGMQLWFTHGGVIADLRGAESAHLVLDFPGATPGFWEAMEERDTRATYLVGPKQRWRRNVPSYAKLIRRGLYPGIDLVFRRSESGAIEYDFEAAPGADPRRIRIRVSGARSLFLDDSGSLIAQTGAGPLRQRRPVSWQAGRAIPSRFRLTGPGEAAIEVDPHDPALPLRIDPVVERPSLQGLPDEDAVTCVSGTYAAGYVTRLSSQGGNATKDAVVYGAPITVYFGGSGDDIPGCGMSVRESRISVNYTTAFTVGGETSSTDFAVASNRHAGGGRDGFLATVRIEHGPTRASVAYLTSRYFGGSGEDSIRSIVATPTGTYLAGYTESPDLPNLTGARPSIAGGYDGFAAFLDNAGIAHRTTYLGGAGNDFAHAASLTPDGDLLLAGATSSEDFPTAAPYQRKLSGSADAFATRLDAGLKEILFSTYYGGTGTDWAAGIRHDPARLDSFYLAGTTDSRDLPLRDPRQSKLAGGTDAFLARFSHGGERLGFATYWGGSRDEEATSLTASVSGDAVIGGATESADFPVADAAQSVSGGASDGFLTLFDAATTVPHFSTYAGGTGDDRILSVSMAQNERLAYGGVAGAAGLFGQPTPLTPAIGGPDGLFGGILLPILPIEAVPILGNRAKVSLGNIARTAGVRHASSDPGKVFASPSYFTTAGLGIDLEGRSDSGEATFEVQTPGAHPRVMKIILGPTGYGFREREIVMTPVDVPRPVAITAAVFDPETLRRRGPANLSGTRDASLTNSRPDVVSLDRSRISSAETVSVTPLAVGEAVLTVETPESGAKISDTLKIRVVEPSLSIECAPIGKLIASTVTIRTNANGRDPIGVSIEEAGRAEFDKTYGSGVQTLTFGGNRIDAKVYGLADSGEVTFTATQNRARTVSTRCPLVPSVATAPEAPISLLPGYPLFFSPEYRPLLDAATGRLGEPSTLYPGFTPRISLVIANPEIASYEDGRLIARSPGTTEFRVETPDGFVSMPSRQSGRITVPVFTPDERVYASGPLAYGFETPLSAFTGTTAFRSSDPSKLRLSAISGVAGSESATANGTLYFGTLNPATVYAQAVGTGQVEVTASVDGVVTRRTKFDIWPSGFVFAGGSPPRGAVAHGPPVAFSLHGVAIDPGTGKQTAMATLAPQFSGVRIPVINEAPETGTVSFTPGIPLRQALLPGSPGTARLRIADQPDGFTAPATGTTATIEVGPIALPDVVVGRRLQTPVTALRGSRFTANRATITSSNPDVARLSLDPLLEGTASVEIATDWSSALWVQAGTVEGTATLTLSVPGLPAVTSTVTVVPAGIRVLNESPILFSPAALRVAAAALDPVTRVPLTGPDQTIGPGAGGGITIRFASSDAEVADAGATVLPRNAAGESVVRGVRRGRAEIVIVQPEGFEPPAVFDRVQVIVP